MAIDTRVPRSRRALLVGGIGGFAALAASAVGRPLPARAGSDGDVVLGELNTSSKSTQLQNLASGAPPLWCWCPAGDGIAGHSGAKSKSGVYGTSSHAAGFGVFGRNTANSTTGFLGGPAYGVDGYHPQGTAVHGASPNGTGVVGEGAFGVYGKAAGAGAGVMGSSTAGTGVVGESDSEIGVLGASRGVAQPAILARSAADGTGLLGFSGGFMSPWPVAAAKTGVYGYAAQDATARGVYGRTTAGRGIVGQATSGTGVYATATSGYALRAVGRVRLDKCAGIATIAATKSSVVVTPGIDLVSTSAVVATLQGSAGSATTTVSRCVVDATANTFTIYLTKAATAKVTVAWIVLG
jgi:hypothetical protein